MTIVRHGLRSVLRDLRSGELGVLVAAITLAVAATTAVGFFTDRVGKAVVIRSAEVLAADLVLRSNRIIRPDYLEHARELGLDTASLTSFASVVLAAEAAALADIEAAGDTRSGAHSRRAWSLTAKPVLKKVCPRPARPGRIHACWHGLESGRAPPSPWARQSWWLQGSSISAPIRTGVLSIWRRHC